MTSGAPTQTTRIPKRRLGAIPFDATILGLGTAEIPDDEEALKALRLALDAGVNYLDTAPSYRAARSESVVGQIAKTHRDRFFLATKTLERSADGAYREVRESLQRLQTDRIDLIQVHAVNDFATLEQVLTGAVQGLERAKREGIVRHIGITGHTRPEVILRAIESYPFESILVPVSAADHWVNDFVSGVIPQARQRGVAVIGMKALKGVERSKGQVRDAERWLRYAWSCPVDCLIVGFRRYADVLENVRLAQQFQPMSTEEMKQLEQEAQKFANTQVLWWKQE